MSKSILVVGSTALDSVETVAGRVDDALGGSAFFFSAAASLLAPVGLVGVVGGDFPRDEINFLAERGVNLDGLETVPGGLTFRWGGRYHENMNDRTTLFTDLNVFESFDPHIPHDQRSAPVLFLANIQPTLQLNVLDQMIGPELVVTDTMNLWINLARPELLEVVRRTGIFIVNDEEARMLTGETSPLRGAQALQAMGPHTVIVKKGEHGALMVGPEGRLFSMPAWPLADITDPTGAGDTFAGGFVGSLAHDGAWGWSQLCRAMAWGSAMASFCVQDFSVNRLRTLDLAQARERFEGFRALTTIPA
ncbi:MAG: sugar kinase [Candidatus Delongbacteria bacterium]|nr:sugar kinase [Candidatus Delongbacteria bacterium]